MENAVVSNANPSGIGIYPVPKLTPKEEQREMKRIGMIITKYGDFIRADKEGNFDKSEIAYSKEQIGLNTKQLILAMGFL